MARLRWVLGCLGALAAASASFGAQAQTARSADGVVEGHVVELQEGELVVDLGGSSGLRDGDRLELWRPIVLRHPVTKKLLSDRFLIGELELVQVRSSLSLARVVGSPSRAPEPGDVVLLAAQAAAPAVPGVAAPASSTSTSPSAAPLAPQPSAPTPSVEPQTSEPPAAGAGTPAPAGRRDIHAERISKLMVALRGVSPERRATAYEKLAEVDVGTPYAAALRDEAAALRRAASTPRTATASQIPQVVGAPRSIGLREGEPPELALQITYARGAVLHVRAKGKPSFTSLPMLPRGPGFFAVPVPAEELQAPAIELFVEATDAEGRAIAVHGSSEMPVELEVRAREGEPPPRDYLATLKLSTDYADYNRLRGNDYAWQTEGELGLRLGDEGVRAVRSGFGVYRGEGGGVDELDERGLAPRAVGLTYGYLEGEFAPHHAFSILPRLVVGLGDDGVTGGAQLNFRVGNDLETNLLVGAEILGGVGARGIAQLELAVFERFPIVFRTEVTNQPAGSAPSRPPESPLDPGEPPLVAQERAEVGGRGIVEVGYRVVDSFVLRLRGSFQGRTIQHAGPGVGGGVSYTW